MRVAGHRTQQEIWDPGEDTSQDTNKGHKKGHRHIQIQYIILNVMSNPDISEEHWNSEEHRPKLVEKYTDKKRSCRTRTQLGKWNTV